MSEPHIDPEEVTAVILAGGFGTRLREVIGELPKPMARVQGRPFIEWILEKLRREGVRRVILSAGYRAEVIRHHFAKTRVEDMEILVATETQPLGTAGGFRHAIECAPSPALRWLILNGDSLVAAPLAPLLRAGREDTFFAALVGVWMEDAARYGSLQIGEPDHQLIRFGEKQPGAALINSGIYLISQAAVNTLPAQRPLSWECDVFPAWLKAGRPIRVLPVDAPFLDIGVPEDFARADEFVAAANGIPARKSPRTLP